MCGHEESWVVLNGFFRSYIAVGWECEPHVLKGKLALSKWPSKVISINGMKDL